MCNCADGVPKALSITSPNFNASQYTCHPRQSSCFCVYVCIACVSHQNVSPRRAGALPVKLTTVPPASSTAPGPDLMLSHQDMNNSFWPSPPPSSHHAPDLPRELALPVRPNVHVVKISVLVMSGLWVGSEEERQSQGLLFPPSLSHLPLPWATPAVSPLMAKQAASCVRGSTSSAVGQAGLESWLLTYGRGP